MREDESDGTSTENTAVRTDLLKYIRSQAELEFKTKLELLRQMKKKARPAVKAKKKTHQRIAELSKGTPTKKQ